MLTNIFGFFLSGLMIVFLLSMIAYSIALMRGKEEWILLFRKLIIACPLIFALVLFMLRIFFP